MIGTYAFLRAGLEEIVLNQGLEEILRNAFCGTHIRRLELPASINRFESGNISLKLKEIVLPEFFEEITDNLVYANVLDTNKDVILRLQCGERYVYLPRNIKSSMRKEFNNTIKWFFEDEEDTGDVTTEDAGDMTAEDPVTTPTEASAELVGEWFGVLGSSPVNLTLAGDYTYNLNLLDIGETTSGTYTTNGNQVALQLNDGIVMTLEVAADAKTMTAVDSVEGTLAKASTNTDTVEDTTAIDDTTEDTITEDSFEGAWQATDAVVTSKFEVAFPGIDERYGLQESSKSYSLVDIDDIAHMTVYIQDGTLDFYINKCDGSYASFEGMKTTLDGDKLYFENSGNMTKLQGYVKDCDDGVGKDIVFETDGKDITFHLTTECNDAEALEYATDDVIPYAQEDSFADESVSADDVQNNGGYIVQSFGYQD